MCQHWLLLEVGDQPARACEHPEVNVGLTLAGRDRERRAGLDMMGQHLGEVQVGQHVAVHDEEVLQEVVETGSSGPMVPSRAASSA